MVMTQAQIISIDQGTIDIKAALNELTEGAKQLDYKQIRIYNTRSNKNIFTMNKGRTKFLSRDPNWIECLTWDQAVRALDRVNETIRSSNFISYEIIEE